MFFSAKDRPELGGVTLTRISNPESVPENSLIYLDADPTGGAWLPPPVIMGKVNASSLSSKLSYLIPYSGPLFISYAPDLLQTKNVGDVARFKIVAAGGTSPYTYQWYYSDDPVTDFVLIDGTINPTAETSELVNSALTKESAGYYYCIVSDADSGECNSAVMQLIVE